MCVRCVRLPLQQGCGGFAESPAHRGEFVTDVRRHDVADGPCEDPVALQVAQGDGEHTLADPVDGPLELGEAARPRLRLRTISSDHLPPTIPSTSRCLARVLRSCRPRLAAHCAAHGYLQRTGAPQCALLIEARRVQHDDLGS